MRRLIASAGLAAAAIMSLASCRYMTRNAMYSVFPAVTVANGNVYVVGYEQGERVRTFGNLVVLNRGLHSEKWEGRRIPVPDSIRSKLPGYSMSMPLACSITPRGEAVLLVNDNDPIPHPNAIFVLSAGGQTGQALHPPEPYSVFEGAAYANGKIYAVTRPLEDDTGPLYDEGKPVKTLLLEMTTTGQVLRKLEIKIHDPIQHDYSYLNGFLPMAVAGTKLFLLENPGITSEIPDNSHVIRGALQVIDLHKLAVERKVDLAGQKEDVSAYLLFSDEERLYVMTTFGVPLDQFRVSVYEASRGELRRVANVSNDRGKELGSTMWPFAVIRDSVYLADDFWNLAALRGTGRRFEGVPGLREVGRIENAPAK